MRHVIATLAVIVGIAMLCSGLYVLGGCTAEICRAASGSAPGWAKSLGSTGSLEGWFSVAWIFGALRLLEWGRAYHRTNRFIANYALRRLRENQDLETDLLVSYSGCTDEIDLRLHVADLKRRGVLPDDVRFITSDDGVDESPNCFCGAYEKTERRRRGSLVLLILLSCIYIVPGLIYMIFACQGYDVVCSSCGRLLKRTSK